MYDVSRGATRSQLYTMISINFSTSLYAGGEGGIVVYIWL